MQVETHSQPRYLHSVCDTRMVKLTQGAESLR
jgi:hypothetical protein